MAHLIRVVSEGCGGRVEKCCEETPERGGGGGLDLVPKVRLGTGVGCVFLSPTRMGGQYPAQAVHLTTPLLPCILPHPPVPLKPDQVWDYKRWPPSGAAGRQRSRITPCNTPWAIQMSCVFCLHLYSMSPSLCPPPRSEEERGLPPSWWPWSSIR